MSFRTAALLLCWLALNLDLGQAQMDCTGVDCPPLQNCIDSVLRMGACCETCNQTGCACEGYQYYDCIQAGFNNGKVPEGESYFVDFGSTECSCPLGGGKISCNFILCPDIPPNCIEIVQPEDGCTQCERIGCFHSSGTYDAGQYFQLDQCHVCQCPLEGGMLGCTPIPGCDTSELSEPTWGSEIENNSQLENVDTNRNNQQQSPDGPSSGPAAGNTLSTSTLLKSGTEDYNPLIETASPTIAGLDQEPTSTTGAPAHPGTLPAPVSSHRDTSHDRGDVQQTEVPVKSPGDENPQDAHPTPGGAEVKMTTPSTTTATQTATTEDHRSNTRDDAVGTTRPIPVDRFSGHHKHTGDHTQNHSVHQKGQIKPRLGVGEEDWTSQPTVQPDLINGTSMKTSENPELKNQTRRDPRPQDLEQDSDVSAKDLVTNCCETGQKWASVNGHCRNMDPPTKDRHSICWTAQQQCCLGSLREQQCAAGMTAARGGRTCEEDSTDSCGTNSYKECCGCCSLGLQIGREGERCVAHPSLGYHCRHIFMNCCREEKQEEEEVVAGSQGSWHSVQERPTHDYSAPPKKVSDSPYPKEAFSIGEDGDGENGVESPVEVEDVDECLIYQDNICHHRCVNTPGSFRCECFPGYVLQDGYTCVPETEEKDNRLKEEENRPKEDVGAAAEPNSSFIPLSEDITRANPCEGNGPCEQQCTPVDGRPQCFCSPGFSLRTDGHSCEDINECSSGHVCRLDERCVNTVGSFMCQRLITCPTGYQMHNDMCEDIDECVQRSHNCDFGFECVNTQGSFRCQPKTRCSAGYTLDPHGNCIDIDECVALTQPCSHGFNCINTAGSFMCQRKIMCSRGYHASADRTTCVDVDECQSNLHHCGEGQLCHNLPGSYRCECQTGYQYDSFKRMCVDINECWRYQSRLCAQTCENTPGSYQCSCTPGFRLASDGKSCEDINECLANPCSQECANIYGSYQCYCRQGYFLREDGHTCDDIDECSQSIGHLCTYRCVNVPGSYQCECPEYGYTLSPNGRSCRDIDECTTGVHNCSLTDTCYNIQGGYRCLSLVCPPNYRKVSDTRCERISCPDFLGCQNSPMRITYYYLSFQSNIIIPAQIFRIGPSPAYSGDNVIVSITQGNEENYFSTRKLNAYTGAVYLNRQVEGPRDFLLHVEMKLWRQGTFTTFQAKIYVFITANLL